jgi:DNA-directed RNA polymerase subunit M/transcription elongation factor TFIIS
VKEEFMEMGSNKEIGRINPEGEIYKCPACGYQDGFHVSFQLNQETSEGEVYLICPSCHSRFRLGWKISVSPT